MGKDRTTKLLKAAFAAGVREGVAMYGGPWDEATERELHEAWDRWSRVEESFPVQEAPEWTL